MADVVTTLLPLTGKAPVPEESARMREQAQAVMRERALVELAEAAEAMRRMEHPPGSL